MSAAAWDQLGEVFRELQRLAESRQPLPLALETIAAALRTGAMEATLRRVRGRVEEGAPLDQALAEEGDVFPDPLPALVHAGLAADDLPAMLGIVAEHCEAEARLRREMRGILAYPAFTLIVCGCIAALAGGGPGYGPGGEWIGSSRGLGGFLQVFTLQGSLAQRQAAAEPRSVGQALWATMSSPLGMALALLACSVVAWWAVRRLVRSAKWRSRCARLVWRLPAAGPVYRANLATRFLATFGALLRAGVPADRTGALLAKLFPYAPANEAVEELRHRIAEGGPAVDGAKPTPLIPPSVAWLVSGGEQRGDLPAALAEAAELQRVRAERSTQTLRAVWGPVVQLVTGLLVFLLIFVVLTPLAQYYAASIFGMRAAAGWFWW